MRMVFGDVNVYWQHDILTPHSVRAASYGTPGDSGALVPDVGDIIRDFLGCMGARITVRVISVEQIGREGRTAYQVTVTDAPEEA